MTVKMTRSKAQLYHLSFKMIFKLRPVAQLLGRLRQKDYKFKPFPDSKIIEKGLPMYVIQLLPI